MPDLFSGKAAAHQTSQEAEIKDLHAKIGELTVEKDFSSHLNRRGYWVSRKVLSWRLSNSMDGKGRSMKYECIDLHAFETGSETRGGSALLEITDDIPGPHRRTPA